MGYVYAEREREREIDLLSKLAYVIIESKTSHDLPQAGEPKKLVV